MKKCFGKGLSLWQFPSRKILLCGVALCLVFTGCRQNAQIETCEKFIALMMNVPQNAFIEVANAEKIIVGRSESDAGSVVTDSTLFVDTVKEVFRDCVSQEALDNIGNSIYTFASNHERAAIDGWTYELKNVTFEKGEENKFSYTAEIACSIPQGKACAFGNDSIVKEFTLTGLIQLDSNSKVEFFKVNRYRPN